jgi:hypothetical protein
VSLLESSTIHGVLLLLINLNQYRPDWPIASWKGIPACHLFDPEGGGPGTAGQTGMSVLPLEV